ncbi:hypothetical protein BGZ83_010432 [Gryganskiella cystojenkinii]|nr:hypothetical protein BGZ83_010432 [Gryganskiella cystojenkinii]
MPAITAFKSESIKTGDVFALASKTNDKFMLQVKIVKQKFIRLIHRCQLEMEITNYSDSVIQFTHATYTKNQVVDIEPNATFTFHGSGVFTLYVKDLAKDKSHMLYHFGKLRAQGLAVHKISDEQQQLQQ